MFCCCGFDRAARKFNIKPVPLWGLVSPALDNPELHLALLGLVIAGVVKGITGIGYATCAMPLLALAVGVEKALALVVVPGLLSNAAVLTTKRSLMPTLRRFGWLYIGILPGIAVGTLLLTATDKQVAAQGLALMTLAYVAFVVVKPSFSLQARFERPLAAPAGFVNGVLTGLTGSQILPLVPFILALRLEAEEQALAINTAVMIASIALGFALLAAGLMTPQLLLLSSAIAVPAIAATWAGCFCRGWLSVDAVRQLTLAVLVISAGGLLGRPALDAALVAVCGREVAAHPLGQAPSICLAAFEAAVRHTRMSKPDPS